MIESPSNETLRLKLAIAELEQQLARDPLVARKVFVGGLMPKPEDIPQGLPPTPPMDPLAGDKTPTVVEWFRTYWPEEFERRYKDRKGVTVERKFGPAASVQAEEEQGKLTDKVMVAEKQVVLSMVKTPAVSRSNRDKRRDVEAALRANPQKTNREIARETGITHPFVAKMRRHMETVTALGFVHHTHTDSSRASLAS